MTQIFHLLSTDTETGVRSLVVFTPGAGTESASSETHGNFNEILDAVREGADVQKILDLFDLGKTVAKRFDQLTDRISVRGGNVYLDGDLVENALSAQIVRFLEEDVEDWYPLVLFFEKVETNPEPHSREQLFEWLDRHDFTIDEDGDVIGYKGVTDDLKSIHSGPGIVNGEEVNGQLDNSVGNVVEMPRSQVHHDPAHGCSRGLHVGTYEFASTFGSGKTVKVKVNPRDVVSVPTDCNWQKVRCCRYEVLDVIEAKVDTAFARSAPEASEPDDWDYDDDYHEDWEEEDEDRCWCGDPDCNF